MSIRFRVRFVLLAAVLAAVVAAHPALAGATGVDFWNLDEARADLAAATEEGEALSDRDDVVMRRIVIKEGLADDLLAGRTNLAAVAAQFLDLSADEPAYLNALRAAGRGDSDLERAAHNVIDYAERRVPEGASRDALRARLEADLHRLQDADHPAVR